MEKTIHESYARYLSVLKRLDQTDDIEEKSLLFRELTRELAELEARLNIGLKARSAAANTR